MDANLAASVILPVKVLFRSRFRSRILKLIYFIELPIYRFFFLHEIEETKSFFLFLSLLEFSLSECSVNLLLSRSLRVIIFTQFFFCVFVKPLSSEFYSSHGKFHPERK